MKKSASSLEKAKAIVAFHQWIGVNPNKFDDLKIFENLIYCYLLLDMDLFAFKLLRNSYGEFF